MAAALSERSIATAARKVANPKQLAFLSLAAIIAIVAILRTFQYGRSIIGKVYEKVFQKIKVTFKS